jgi:hypothetical protein
MDTRPAAWFVAPSLGDCFVGDLSDPDRLTREEPLDTQTQASAQFAPTLGVSCPGSVHRGRACSRLFW